MPDNEVEKGVHSLYELDNSSQNQRLLQVIGGNWPVPDYNQWVGKPTKISRPLNLNLKNYFLQPLGSGKGHDVESLHMPLNQNYTQVTPRLEYSRSLNIKNSLNTNEILLGCHNFQPKQNQPIIFGGSTCNDQRILSSRGFSIFKSQPENECADSPTLTTNSERSEITESSGDYNFLRGHQQFVKDQELNAPQSHPMQQPGYNDMQLLRQHMMFKQLQEFQRQQQLGELRQQNPINQFSAISRQATGDQFSPLINGTPVHDASHMMRNWMQRGASPVAQGVSNKVIFSQEQGQALHSVGLTPQQLDVSLYGTPISNTRSNTSQYPHLQGLSHDSVNLLAKAGGQVQKSITQSSGFGNPSLGDQRALPNLTGLPQGALISKQELQMKSNFGQHPVQGLNSGLFPGNLQENNMPQVNTSLKEFTGRQEQGGWPVIQQTKQFGSSLGLVPLDPMEVKILYNMDDNIWDAFGSRPDTGAGGFGNMLENLESFPSIQSGSWSALMQSAVAEASSSDTGLQEEWSGLTFQNTDHSTDNQVSNFVDSERQQTGWVDNNLQRGSSFSSKSFPTFTDSSVSSSFPGFHQPGIQLSVEQREDSCKDASHESAVNYNLQKPAVQEVGKDQTFIRSNNSWARQMFEHSQSVVQHQKGASCDISIDKSSESVVKSQHQMSNGPLVAVNSYEEANETHEGQQNCEQRENSNNFLKGSSSHEQGRFKQRNFFGNISSSAMNIDKASIPDFHGSTRTSEDVPSRGDDGSNTSTTFHRSVLPDGSNVNAHTSEHMLELLPKVDQSKDDSTLKQSGSSDRGPLVEMRGADSHDTSTAQLYAQSSASQGFGLRLAPPSQMLVNSSSVLIPAGLPQAINDLNSCNPELGEKSPAWFMPPSSFHSSPSSHELAQRAHWDNKSGTVGHTSFSPYTNIKGNSVVPFSPNRPQTRSQFQMCPSSGVSVPSQPSQALLPGISSRFPPLNQVPSQDTSQPMQKIAVNQQFPVLDPLGVSQPSNMSAISQQGENSARPYNVWRNVPTQQQPYGIEPQKFSNLPSSLKQTNNSMSSTSWAPHGSNDHNSIKVGYKSSEIILSNSQGCGEELPGKEILQQRISSNRHDSSLSGGASQGQEPVSDATTFMSGSLMSHSQQQDVDEVRHSDDLSQASSQRNLESFSHSCNDHHNYALLQQMQSINSADNALDIQGTAALGGQQLHDNISRFRHPLDGRPNSTSLPNSSPSGDAQMHSFSAEARDGLAVKAPLQTSLQTRPQEMVALGYNDSQTQSSSSTSVLSNHSEQGHVNLNMAHSWFKQYGTPRNGQIFPIFDPRLANSAASQFSLGMPYLGLHIQSPLEQLDASDAGQGAKVWPSATVALVASQQLSSSPYMVLSEATNQVSIMRPKKRKTMEFELIPWHKEVIQDSKRLQSISVAEQAWAQATNRLTEKVEDEVEMIEDVQPMHRSKRRLILTTQLVQQLFCPPPASIFSMDSASNYGIISYFVSRLSLGDACSLAYCTQKDFLALANNSNIISEKPKIFERSAQQLSEVVENFMDRANKLENDFQRLDKTASVVEIKADFQELERFAVINRFAKFHVRGQMDASGTSSSSGVPKPMPQSHITVVPLPRNLPEGVQCLSL